MIKKTILMFIAFIIAQIFVPQINAMVQEKPIEETKILIVSNKGYYIDALSFCNNKDKISGFRTYLLQWLPEHGYTRSIEEEKSLYECTNILCFIKEENIRKANSIYLDIKIALSEYQDQTEKKLAPKFTLERQSATSAQSATPSRIFPIIPDIPTNEQPNLRKVLEAQNKAVIPEIDVYQDIFLDYTHYDIDHSLNMQNMQINASTQKKTTRINLTQNILNNMPEYGSSKIQKLKKEPLLINLFLIDDFKTNMTIKDAHLSKEYKNTYDYFFALFAPKIIQILTTQYLQMRPIIIESIRQKIAIETHS